MQERFHATDPDKQAEQLDDFAQQGMEMFVEYMYEHFEEFKLLVNGCLLYTSTASGKDKKRVKR